MTAARTAARIVQQAGMAMPRLPPIAELAELARAYLALTAASPAAGGGRLHEEGQIALTAAAVQGYQEHRRCQPEQARRELLRAVLDARQHTTDLAHWRARSRTSGLDLSLVVEPDDQEPRIVVVVSASVRGYGR